MPYDVYRTDNSASPKTSKFQLPHSHNVRSQYLYNHKVEKDVNGLAKVSLLAISNSLLRTVTEKYKEYTTMISASGNFKTIRAKVEEAVSPYITYLGMYVSVLCSFFHTYRYLTDLTLGDEGNPDFIDGKINYSKRLIMAKTIEEICMSPLRRHP